MSTAPTIIRASDPSDFSWDDSERGSAVYQTRIDAAAGPTSGLVMGTAQIEAGETEAPHTHDLPEMMYVLSGEGTAVFDDREVPIAEGDTVFVPRDTLHSWRAGEAGLSMLYAFPADRFDEVAYHWSDG
jgi:quercetin dioxygenase-like cupin family protein